MAAPPSKPSPSNKEVQQTDAQEPAASLKAPPAAALKDPPAAAAAVSTETETAVSAIPSYERSESSDHYKLAKHLLAEGDFEQALTAIEQGIEETKALLMSVGVEDVDLHESIAPFHYMYGTTLLYSIEESNDTQVTVDTATQTVAAAEAPPAAATAAAAPDGAPQPEDAPAVSSENADDMNIAWENLEVARTIVEGLLTQDTVNKTSKSKLQLDLAQILLRSADLQRLNGRYPEAIQDYEACLQLRKLLLPEFDRKIADAQYNLGLSYLSNSGELQKQDTPENQAVSQEHCQKGIQLYLECGRSLCGQMAQLSGVDPNTILVTHKDQGGFKTTGLETETNMGDASQTLSLWRKNASSLASGEVVDDLKDTLDIIQETIDEAEKSQDAIRQAAQLKVQAQKAITKEDEGGVTTTIGFDKPTLSADATATAAAAKPMMVVKKKKKRDAPSVDYNPWAQNDSEKKEKTE